MNNKCGNCSRNSVSQISGNWNCRIKENENKVKKLLVKDLRGTILFDKVVVHSINGEEEFIKKDCKLDNGLGYDLYEEGQINMLAEESNLN